jgi:hypothetical protein
VNLRVPDPGAGEFGAHVPVEPGAVDVEETMVDVVVCVALVVGGTIGVDAVVVVATTVVDTDVVEAAVPGTHWKKTVDS